MAKKNNDIIIQVGVNRCKLIGGIKVLMPVQKALSLRNKNAYYLRSNGYMPAGWDGYNQYVSDIGTFDTGLLPEVVRQVEKVSKRDILMVDHREISLEIKVPKDLNGIIPRPYQVEAVKKVVENTIGELQFPQGILAAATNAGKTIIAALVHRSVKGAKTVFLINQSDLYEDAIRDIPDLLGPNEVGHMRGPDVKWGNFMICMVPTLRSKMPLVVGKLGAYNTLVFDECDTALAPTNKKIMQKFYNAHVKVGMSGSVDTHKDPNKNRKLHAMFGDTVFTIKNHELQEMGHSSPVKVRILKGNEEVHYKGDYDAEYENGITFNKKRNNRIVKRVGFMLAKKRYPMMIITPKHNHINELYHLINDRYGDAYRVEMVHHKTKERKAFQRDFEEGKIDIFIASYILKRGKNFPLMRYLCNAGGGLSAANVLQILGRILRRYPGKQKMKFIDDFWDQGAYLKRHSKHRWTVYKSEKLLLNDSIIKSKTARKHANRKKS